VSFNNIKGKKDLEIDGSEGPDHSLSSADFE
jgi:hypothetical protein